MQQSVTSNGTTTTTSYIGSYEEVSATSGTTVVTKYSQAGPATVENVGGTYSYLAADAQGSVSVALSSGGVVTASQLFAPYGATRYSSGVMPTSYGFTGQRSDPSGLAYFHARYYDPTVGQFISADSVQGLNRYGYVQGNPTTLTDPSGNMACAVYADGLCQRGPKGAPHPALTTTGSRGAGGSGGKGDKPALTTPNIGKAQSSYQNNNCHNKLCAVNTVYEATGCRNNCISAQDLLCYSGLGCANLLLLKDVIDGSTHINWGNVLLDATGAIAALVLAVGAFVEGLDLLTTMPWLGIRAFGLGLIGIGLALYGISQVLSEMAPNGGLSGITDAIDYTAQSLVLGGAAAGLTGSVAAILSSGWILVNTLYLIGTAASGIWGFVKGYESQQ